MSDEVLLDQAEAETLAIRACRAAGAAQSTARPLDATLSAALFGPATLGFPHMVDYLDSFREGRINCNPTRSRRARIPEGWAVDETGMDTRDAARALAGALLPFGGRKGANVALMVEMLSTGLSGGPWSLDTPSFRSGSPARRWD
ncbi:Ldh family oxidoreductase [Rhizobium mulingense]|uniref:Ldh family oxidoreductase n=1 Tax=Rhizobium mulingense TaxID=3031128 RepID=UPI003A7F2A20